MKDKVTLKTAGRFAVRDTEDGSSEVRIVPAQRSDAGVYICKIINEYGTKESECRLEVKGRERRVYILYLTETTFHSYKWPGIAEMVQEEHSLALTSTRKFVIKSYL